jgi:methylmalonyl-CoA epimerase
MASRSSAAKPGSLPAARLDHVGIAVGDIEQALAFWRDALGLDVHAPEHVADQRVDARFIPAGGAAIELLSGTDADSVIAKFVRKRGPGLHHITLCVDDIRAALARLKARGVALVDEEPRQGAGGALVAFVHPSAAHGVLVELTQRPQMQATLATVKFTIGDMQLTVLHDGPFRLDGGAMFGVVPRTMWEARAPADERHRIQLAMRPLLVEAGWGRMLVDCGAGDKMSAKLQDIYALDRLNALPQALAGVGLEMSDITTVLATHLHFDHFGGATRRDGAVLRPSFPAAQYVIREAEWEDATHPHERNRASYLQDDFVPLREAGVVTFHRGDDEIKPGVRVVRTGGHTGQHQIVFIESSGQTAVFVADLIPTTAHLQDAWVMGYDLFPLETLAFKRTFIREAIEREYVIVFEHDPHVGAGYIREDREGRRYVEPVA